MNALFRLITSIVLILFMCSAAACDSRQKLSEACGEGTREKGGLYDIDGDGYLEDVDCDESDCTINPGSQEVCDGIDNDCDDNVDGADDDLKEIVKGETAKFYIDKDCDGVCEDDIRTLCIATDIATEHITAVYKDGDGRHSGTVDYAFTTCSTSYEVGDYEDYDDNNYISNISYYIYKGVEEYALGPDWRDYFDDCGDADCETDPYCTYPEAATFGVTNDPSTLDFPEGSVLDEECLAHTGPGRTCATMLVGY